MASCSPVQYNLTISSTEGGDVTTPGEGTYTYDARTMIDLVATPNAGYQFIGWTGNVTDIADVNAAATNITMNGDYSVTANFVPIHKIIISSTAGGSVIEPGEGHFDYAANTTIDLVAVANEQYRFVNWTGDVSTIVDVNAAITTITMNDDYFVMANFVPIYELTISSTQFGTVTIPGEGTFTYDGGTIVNLSAEAEEDYTLINWTGDVDTIDNVNATVTTITMTNNYAIIANFGWSNVIQVAGGGQQTVGLKSDGTVVAVGWNQYEQCDVDSWTDITEVAGGQMHTVGLKSDGTVVAVGLNFYGQCDTFSLTDIIQVAAGGHHTVGLKADGTVAALGGNGGGQCDVDDWTDIIQVASGYGHTVGLKSDGTVVAVGLNSYGQCNITCWSNIIQIGANSYNTVGLKSDGTVVAVGNNEFGQCNVNDWTNIAKVAIGYGYHHTVGLKSDGTVVAVGARDPLDYGQCDVDSWADISQVAAGGHHTVALKSDGTVVAVGRNNFGQCDVRG
jgi:uncharacterized repeat protein (TIGR02543 family)